MPDCTPHVIVDTPSDGPSGRVVNRLVVGFHLRITDDQVIETVPFDWIIPAAEAFCESEVSGRRKFVTATCEISVDEWWDGLLQMPLPPLQSVCWIKYLDAVGDEQTLSTDDYLVRLANRQRGTVELVALQMPYLYQYNSYPITIRFVCGYGTDPSVMPPAIRQAVLLAVGWMYRDREPTKVEFDTVKRLLNSEGFGWY